MKDTVDAEMYEKYKLQYFSAIADDELLKLTPVCLGAIMEFPIPRRLPQTATVYVGTFALIKGEKEVIWAHIFHNETIGVSAVFLFPHI